MNRLIAISVLATTMSVCLPSAAKAEQPRRSVWVFFRDKGPGAQDERALRASEHRLSARALERRRRSRGASAVDERDVDLDPASVARVEATGARIRVRSRWLNAVSVAATEGQRAALAALPEVDRVVPVRSGRRMRPPELERVAAPGPARGGGEFGLAQAQLALVGIDVLQRDCGLTGAGVVVGVQDGGFDLGHQALAGSTVLAEYDFVHDDDVVGLQAGDPPGVTDHGTVVLAAMAGSDPGSFIGSAPGVQLVLSKTERHEVEIEEEEDLYVAGIEWVEAQGADIFLASLGYFDWHTPEDFDGQTTVSAIAVNTAFDNGMFVVVSAGNAGPEPSTVVTPADAPGALAVGASTVDGTLVYFSSRGPTADGRIKPDVVAPGGAVYSVDPSTTDGYRTHNGTSLAAPLVAGLAALLLEARPELDAAALDELVRQTASQAGAPDNDLGWGIVDGLAASGSDCGCDDADGDGFLGVLCGGGDCDESDASTYPGAPEACDGIDHDCDGRVLAAVDRDGDGVMECEGDCDDSDPSVGPGQPEICGDGLDNDCDDGDMPCPATTGGADGSTSSEDADGGTSSSLEGGTSVDASASASASDESGAAGDGDSGGCGCVAAPPRPTSGWALLMLLLGRGRRRGSTRSRMRQALTHLQMRQSVVFTHLAHLELRPPDDAEPRRPPGPASLPNDFLLPSVDPVQQPDPSGR